MNLDHVHAVLQLQPRQLPHLVRPVGNREVALVGKRRDAHLRRVAVQVAVPAGHGDARAAGDDARPDDDTLADRVAQVHRQERPRADVAHGGETRVQRGLGIHHRRKARVIRRVLELVDLVEPIGPAAQVRVAVDQSRQHDRVAQIDHLGAGGNR